MAPRRKAKTGMVKPKITLKEAIIRVLQEAGPGGLTVRQIVQKIKEKKWWDWENDNQGYESVSKACRRPIYRDVFVHVAPGTYALWALQDDDFDPNEKPKTLKEAIILVLEEAGPEGLTVRQIVQRIKKKKWWDWKNDKAGSTSVSNTCLDAPDTFVKHRRGVYALKSLQGRGEGSSKRCNACEETDNGSGSSSMICEETCVSSKQDEEEEEEDQAMDVKATTLTASGRVSKVPPRLSSVDEWKRVMECPQQAKRYSNEPSSSSPRGTKRRREAAIHRPHQKPGRPRKIKTVEKCIIRPYVYTNVKVHEDGRLFLFSDEYANSIKTVWA